MRIRRRLMLPQAPRLTYVVGDVHGCLDLYDRLEASIRDHVYYGTDALEDTPILVVLAGDLVDRGAQSAAVLDRMLGPAPVGLQRLALAGNHEDMFLRFLDAPRGDAPWLNYGGVETLLSYGLQPDPMRGFALNGVLLRQMIDATVPQAHIDALRSFPVSLRIPGYLISHAGLNAQLPLVEQSDYDLMWSDPTALDTGAPATGAVADLRQEGLVSVHGHVPQETASVHPLRICVDTGAYATGRLTAVCLQPGAAPEFLSVSA